MDSTRKQEDDHYQIIHPTNQIVHCSSYQQLFRMQLETVVVWHEVIGQLITNEECTDIHMEAEIESLVHQYYQKLTITIRSFDLQFA